ncbi:polyketide cyclase [Aspergillus niger]|uniref:Probable cyclase otaY n=2 Tax=Aspergillus niger TaxID=5061 RepID=OTAY_ASPNC|nr:RecName: Full=Probable cyclase otaY; AltName: Full=Ochratoxin A biosynthesis cluster protein Y [Aspergillus niger CBS 513.88]RDH22078.1 hypothetical protein M747DRAFT_294295 [Aspergillus niger ATCC 13496]GJP89752.1 polyketide cyclase [Aspergillus niger]
MDLKSRAETFLTTIVNRRETASIEHYLHPDAQFKHNDLPSMSTAELLAFWPQVLDESPDFRVQILATIAEGLRVWVYSRVEGRLGKGVMDDVHMLEFDGNGLLIRSRGIQREVVEEMEK